jgi:hypothetical protein
MSFTHCHASSWPSHPPFSALVLASQVPTRSWVRRKSEYPAYWKLQSCGERSRREKGRIKRRITPDQTLSSRGIIHSRPNSNNARWY